MSANSYVSQAAREYAEEFDIPSDELRDWYRNSDDKPGLVEYMIQQVQSVRDWRQTVADQYHARQLRKTA